MLQVDDDQAQVLELTDVPKPKDFIERMEMKLEIKEALHRNDGKRRFIERLNWLNFDGPKKHLLL